MYRGYALLFWNKVSCVLSLDRIIGTIVAPGLSCSRASYVIDCCIRFRFTSAGRFLPVSPTTTTQYACRETCDSPSCHWHSASRVQTQGMEQTLGHQTMPSHTLWRLWSRPRRLGHGYFIDFAIDHYRPLSTHYRHLSTHTLATTDHYRNHMDQLPTDYRSLPGLYRLLRMIPLHCRQRRPKCSACSHNGSTSQTQVVHP